AGAVVARRTRPLPATRGAAGVADPAGAVLAVEQCGVRHRACLADPVIRPGAGMAWHVPFERPFFLARRLCTGGAADRHDVAELAAGRGLHGPTRRLVPAMGRCRAAARGHRRERRRAITDRARSRTSGAARRRRQGHRRDSELRLRHLADVFARGRAPLRRACQYRTAARGSAESDRDAVAAIRPGYLYAYIGATELAHRATSGLVCEKALAPPGGAAPA